MVNKEECREALSKARIMLEEYMWKNNLTWAQQLEFRDAIITLEDLYLEHFNNQPLKFEELKAISPYWDKKEKEWCYFVSLHKDIETGVKISISNPPMMGAFKFEENRFYRKQVK